MGITISSKGDWEPTATYLRGVREKDLSPILHRHGQQGVAALSAATPVDQDVTANSWSYEVVSRKGYYSLRFFNSNVNDGRPVAILIQYGHGTRNGGYVQGRDYINPAIQPIFDQIAEEAWKEVTQ